jgi:ubiquinone/menaquinone biosynthesis C-methylase UbiE
MDAADNPARIYEEHQVRALFEPWARILIDIARPAPGECVLDAACGTGILARLAAASRIGPTGRIIGVDFDPGMIAVARELLPEGEWQEGDLQQLPFADGAFDLVMCQQGLQFLPDRAAGLRQMHRVLRPGGRVALSIWTTLANSPAQARLFGALGKLLGTDMSAPPPWSLSNGEDVAKLMSSAGFVDVESKLVMLTATYPSARRFVQIHLDGASKLTRQVLNQLPSDRRAAFIDDVVGSLSEYETSAGLRVSNESRIVVGHKSRG